MENNVQQKQPRKIKNTIVSVIMVLVVVLLASEGLEMMNNAFSGNTEDTELGYYQVISDEAIVYEINYIGTSTTSYVATYVPASDNLSYPYGTQIQVKYESGEYGRIRFFDENGYEKNGFIKMSDLQKIPISRK